TVAPRRLPLGGARAPPPIWAWCGTSAVCSPRFLQRYGEVLLAKDGCYLYRVRPEGVEDPSTSGESLLAPELPPHLDGSGRPQWLLIGRPRVERAGGARGEDGAAVQVTFDDCLHQLLPVRPDALYTLAADFWSEQAGQAAYLQLNWRRADGSEVQNDYLEFPAGGEPQPCMISGWPPP